MSAPILYCFPIVTFNASKALLAAEESGIDYELVLLDPASGEHKSDLHRQRHPLGKIPALVHDGAAVFESLAIARYVDALAGNPLMAGSALGDARINQWADFAVNHVGRAVGTLYLEQYLKPVFRRQSGDDEAIAGAIAQLGRELPVLNTALNDHAYFGGDTYSLADIVVLAYLLHEDNLSIDLSPYEALAQWFAAASERPATTNALGRLANQASA
ncbi:MAG: glutathione S-transferase family protein [Pseudomonadota bacterium]